MTRLQENRRPRIGTDNSLSSPLSPAPCSPAWLGQDAYLKLIQQLLNCNSGKESEILQMNQDLLDAEFLRMVEAVAEMMSEKGDENTANWLRSLGNQLAKALNLYVNSSSDTDKRELTQKNLQVYYQFLIKLLQITYKSKGDAEVIYPLLEANIDKLDRIFAEILRSWAMDKFRKLEADNTNFLNSSYR